MIGKKLAHYEVLAALGKGGMGEVYRARDTKLGREVALKLLPAELAENTNRRARFEREAQAVASLNHSNVVTLYAVEEADGVSFLSMELVEGKTLDQVIPPGGLSLPRFLELARPLCAAVAAAHAKGITHRDLKPQNVMIDVGGRLKVLDFGLAKMLESEADIGEGTMEFTAHATREGAIIGTAAYMSPEQAEGKEVDARSDVFSLGVLFYEMLTGQRAFQGDTQMSTLTAVLRDEPRAVLELRPELPRQVVRILRRCLEKDPERRHESAKSLSYELEILEEETSSGEFERVPRSEHPGEMTQRTATADSSAASSAGAASPRSSASADSASGSRAEPSYSSANGDSIGSAVPAGSTGSRGSKRAWLLWAGTVAVLAILAVIFAWSQRKGPDGGPIAGNPAPVAVAAEPIIVVFPFQNLGPPEDAYFAAGITDEILTSLIQVDGLRVLSRTSAQQYDRSGKTMQQVADDLGVDYVLEGSVRWQRSETGPSRVRVTPQLVAAHEDEQVWAERYDRTMDEIFVVQTQIADAVVRQLGVALAGTMENDDPVVPTENMEAYHAYLRAKSIVDGTRYTGEEWFLAVQLFERAVQLDPEFHEAWAELAKAEAGICHFGWDQTEDRLAKSLTAADRATRLAPDDPRTHLARGYYHYWGLKDYGPALEAFRQAQAQRPKDPEIMVAIAYVQRRQGDFATAVNQLLRAVEYSPQDGPLYYHIGETYAVLRDYEQADRWVRKSMLLNPDRALSYSTAAWIAVLAGDAPRVREVLASMPVHSDPDVWGRTGQFYFHLGDYSEALEYAEKLPEAYTSQYWAISRSLALARIYRAMGREDAARESWALAAQHLGEALRQQPESGTLSSANALALAGLGQREEALELAERAVNMFPSDKDLWIRGYRVYDLALVQILTGDHEAAVQTLRDLMATQTDAISTKLLSTSPDFDPLRDRDDFKALLRAQS